MAQLTLPGLPALTRQHKRARAKKGLQRVLQTRQLRQLKQNKVFFISPFFPSRFESSGEACKVLASGTSLPVWKPHIICLISRILRKSLNPPPRLPQQVFQPVFITILQKSAPSLHTGDNFGNYNSRSMDEHPLNCHFVTAVPKHPRTQ